jgi:HNH endonuclease
VGGDASAPDTGTGPVTAMAGAWSGVAAWVAGLRLEWLEAGGCAHRREVAGYRPSAVLAHLIGVRQQVCAFPGCGRAAQRCDLDHTIAYDRGGRTCECNLAPLCRRHHRAKQAPGWRLGQPEPGIMVWTTPSGRSYTTHPSTYPEPHPSTYPE